jgi:hypothetical protein
MKSTLKELIGMLKDLVPEMNPEKRSYNNMRLIPVPVKNQGQKRPNPYNPSR